LFTENQKPHEQAFAKQTNVGFKPLWLEQCEYAISIN